MRLLQKEPRISQCAMADKVDIGPGEMRYFLKVLIHTGSVWLRNF
jgi:hypothetical protein